MSEDATDGARPNLHDDTVLLYDFLKFLTTLALLVLGGILNLAMADINFPVKALIGVTALVAIAGLSALGGAAEIIKARQRGLAASKRAYLLSRASMMFFGVGLGSFLAIWLK